MGKYYAGIGSRDAPHDNIVYMMKLGKFLAELGYTLNSGGAEGSDDAFEKGCDEVNGLKDIYLPWQRFNNSQSNLVVENIEAFRIAEKYHPNWNNLKQGAKKLQARNTHQVLGLDCKTPVDFVLCYTKNGKGSGGTGQALRIAKAYNIPVFDFGLYDTIEDVKHWLSIFLLCHLPTD